MYKVRRNLFVMESVSRQTAKTWKNAEACDLNEALSAVRQYAFFIPATRFQQDFTSIHPNWLREHDQNLKCDSAVQDLAETKTKRYPLLITNFRHDHTISDHFCYGSTGHVNNRRLSKEPFFLICVNYTITVQIYSRPYART